MAGEMQDQSNRVQASRQLRMSLLKSAKASFSAKSSPLTYGNRASDSSRFLLAILRRRVQKLEQAREVRP